MTGEERRREILNRLKREEKAVPAHVFASEFHVSRQVIVQDVAMLRMGGAEILAGKYGYFIHHGEPVERVFKVIHSDEETEEELCLYVDYGGRVEDVFVYHKVYGVLRAGMNIRSRHDVHEYMKSLQGGKSSLLKNITAGYHYHTVSADSRETLDRIQKALEERGFLAPLQDYEPVNFWDRYDE